MKYEATIGMEEMVDDCARSVVEVPEDSLVLGLAGTRPLTAGKLPGKRKMSQFGNNFWNRRWNWEPKVIAAEITVNVITQ